MEMNPIQESELILNPDGSIFHLHLLPEQIARTIILVGDPGRVDMVASYFDSLEMRVSNREFKTATGTYKGKRLSVVSTGIGTDNVDIVLNELDALVNIDLKTRIVRKERTALNLIRLGTSGALQPDIPVDSFVLTGMAIGFDGLLNFYAGRDRVCDLEMEKAFCRHTSWSEQLPLPYFAPSSEELMRVLSDYTIEGVTISAPGFYGPQGRVLRIPLAHGELNSLISSFSYKGRRITNFEMESSAINGLSLLLGHRSATICAIIANRLTGMASPNYKLTMNRLVEETLSRLAVIDD